MAGTSTRGESFTSSPSLPPRYHDVFLSFKGDDTRKNFTDHLLAALRRNGFVTFIDDKLKRGEEIGPELLKTIEGSRVAVIVFSRNYAASSWCLDELVKIMECRSTFQHMVLPVFYDVDPSDVRAQMGSFGESFGRHKEPYEKGKVERWTAALTEAANLSGWHLQDVADGHESRFIEKIMEDISNKLNLRYSNIVDYPIGMESRVQHVNRLLTLGSHDVRMVGIWGIGGVGKTTVAKAIYNLIHHKFEGSSFLANVREISKQPNGLIGLQEQLLSDILMNKKQNIKNVDQGIEVIKQRLWCRKVLIIIDDVDEFEQLNAFALRRDWFHSGSRIIATTRDESLLNWLKVDAIYEPELLTSNESLELFSWHAFRKDRPIEDYVDLSGSVVGYAGGLPLVLKVLGCFLFDKTMLEWKDALEKLKVIPHDDIQEKLKISFDSLNDEEKILFLDIACFFVGMDQNYTIEILKGCGFFPVIGIGVLTRRCLLRINELNQLTMHDMVRDMGREIVRKENLNEPGRRSRLWSDNDSRDVLENHTGTKAVEGLILNFPGVQVNAITFAKMNKLRLLKLNNVYLSDNCYEHLSKRLRWLYWSCFPLESIPSNLFMEEMVSLEMPYSSLKQVWKASKVSNKLKFLNLSHSYRLTKTPDFSGLTNLEILLLSNCIRLVKVHHSIECLEKLVVLDLKNCKNLRKLPLGIWKLTSLQKLSLHGCSKLEKLSPASDGSISKPWFSPFLSFIQVVRNPFIPSPTCRQGLISIKELDLTDCNLSNVPDEIGSLLSLEVLNLVGNNFYTLPDSISHLSKLQFLCLNQCTRLTILPKLPESLIGVGAMHCPLLETIPVGNGSSSLQRRPNGLYFIIPQVSRYFSCHCHNLFHDNHESNFGSYSRNQGLSRVDELNISLPNVELPSWYDYVSLGSNLSFVIPKLKVREWAIGIICTIHRDERVSEHDLHYLPPFFYIVKNKTKGFQKRYEPAIHEYPMIFNDYILLHYAKRSNLELQIEAGDKVECSVLIVNPLFLVKKCGMFLFSDYMVSSFGSTSKGWYIYLFFPCVSYKVGIKCNHFDLHSSMYNFNDVTNSNEVPAELVK